MGPAAVFAFVGGLSMGSFVTVVAHRVPRGDSIVHPRSRCPGCDAPISARDNIPVVSWLLLKGRCRGCGERISPVYPATELILGLLYMATVVALWDDVTEVLLGLVFVSILATITLTDLELRIIPNRVLLVGATIGLAIAAVGDPGSLPERFVAATAAGGLLFLAALAYPKGMGLGDVKLAAVMGLFLGWNVAPAILLALLLGSLVGVVLIAREGAAARKRAIPFGPFLAIGGIVGLLAGSSIVDWYLTTFS